MLSSRLGRRDEAQRSEDVIRLNRGSLLLLFRQEAEKIDSFLARAKHDVMQCPKLLPQALVVWIDASQHQPQLVDTQVADQLRLLSHCRVHIRRPPHAADGAEASVERNEIIEHATGTKLPRPAKALANDRDRAGEWDHVRISLLLLDESRRSTREVVVRLGRKQPRLRHHEIARSYPIWRE